MGKRLIYVIDSSVSSNLYGYLCMNIPQELLCTCQNEITDIESLELFYFNHKDDVFLNTFFADKTMISFVLFFSSLFGQQGKALLTLNNIVEDVYVSHSREENMSILAEHRSEQVLSYLEEILQQISSQDDQIVLMTKCKNLINDLANYGHLDYPPVNLANEVLLQFAYKQITQIVSDWMDKSSDIEIYSSFNWNYESFRVNNHPLCWSPIPSGKEIHSLDDLLQNMSLILEKASYSYEDFTENDKIDFLNLWVLLVTSGYNTILPSSFFETIRRLLPNIS